VSLLPNLQFVEVFYGQRPAGLHRSFVR
jgi:hypothetical protein